MNQFDLSDFFQTKSQAQDFSLRLGAIAEKIYETNFNLESALLHQFGMQKKDKFMSFLRNNNVSAESVAPLKEIISKIQEQITTMPVISLTLAIEPNEELIKSVSDWFLLNFKKHMLFDIHVDTNLIAGTTITFGGKYGEYSLKTTFEEILKNESTIGSDTTIAPVNYQKYNATPLNANQAVAQNA